MFSFMHGRYIYLPALSATATVSSGVGAYRCASCMMAMASQSDATYPSSPQLPLNVLVSRLELAHAGTPLTPV
jgi:hypothetical protein